MVLVLLVLVLVVVLVVFYRSRTRTCSRSGSRSGSSSRSRMCSRIRNRTHSRNHSNTCITTSSKSVVETTPLVEATPQPKFIALVRISLKPKSKTFFLVGWVGFCGVGGIGKQIGGTGAHLRSAPVLDATFLKRRASPFPFPAQRF